MIDDSYPIPFLGRAGDTVVLRHLVRLGTGALATAFNVSHVDVTVKQAGEDPTCQQDYGSGQGELALNTIITASVVQDDPLFDNDTNDDRTADGYNMKWIAPASAFPLAGVYTAQFRFTGGDGSVTTKVFEGRIRGALT